MHTIHLEESETGSSAAAKPTAGKQAGGREQNSTSRDPSNTKLGVRWIEESVDKNGTARQNLKIPYSNLAVMYKALGDTSLAEKITKQAEAIIIK